MGFFDWFKKEVPQVAEVTKEPEEVPVSKDIIRNVTTIARSDKDRVVTKDSDEVAPAVQALIDAKTPPTPPPFVPAPPVSVTPPAPQPKSVPKYVGMTCSGPHRKGTY